MTDLTEQQKRFVAEYCVDFNSHAAARRAGYHTDTAKRLMRMPAVRAAIRAECERTNQAVGICREWLLEQMVEMYERCTQAVAVIDDEGKVSGEWGFDVAGALKALDLIGKYHDLAPAQKLEIAGKDGGPILTKDMTENEAARRVAFVLEKGLRAKRSAVDGFDDLLH